MLAQVSERCGQAPEAWLLDGGHVPHEQIERASATTTAYGPVPAAKEEGMALHAPKANDRAAASAWRERMESEEA